MKILAALMLLCASAFATDTIEMPIFHHAVPVSVSISTYQYTNATSAATRIRNLSAILIDNPSTNSGTVHGHIGDCTSTSISTSTVKGPIEIAPSLSGGVIGIAEDECLWLVSRNASTEAVTIQGISQTR